jgi:putative ABC transport system permease protein
MLLNTILLAFKAMARNKMRSFLTILGIVIGVSAVITMVTLGNGATQAVSDQIASLGSNLLLVMPGQRMGASRDGASAPNFKVADAEALQAQIAGIKAVAPTVGSSVTAVAMARNWTTSVTGSTPIYFEVNNWKIGGGRIFTDSEERAGKAVCVIGDTVRKKLFGENHNPLGTEIRLKQFSCEIIGLLQSRGQGGMGRDQDDTIIMPLRTVQRRLIGKQDVSSISVSARDGVSTDVVRSQITSLLRERRKIAPDAEDNFNVLDTKEFAATMTSATGILTALLGAVAAVSLLVGGIGIMNIMLVSITERTREIGTRLAIGAMEREVMMQFLVEAMALSSFGGFIGIVLAGVATSGLSKVMSLPYSFDVRINIIAFVFSAAIGVIFGYVPAKRAARLDPIEALRHE